MPATVGIRARIVLWFAENRPKQEIAALAPVVVSPGLRSRSWDAYLGSGVPGGADVSQYAAPARGTDLGGLPPAYVSVMKFDPLRDEGIAYAQALLAAGVTVELHLFPGTFHGSMLIRDAAISKREANEAIVVLRNVFGG